MLAALAGVVQNRQGTSDNNHCSAQRDQCRLHFVASQTEAPEPPLGRKLIPAEMNAG